MLYRGKKMRTTKRISLALLMLFTTLVAAEKEQIVECELTEQDAFMPATDGFGKVVYTKQEFTYSCKVTDREKVCLEWGVSKKDINQSEIQYEEQYETLDFSNNFGGATLLVSSLNKLDKLFTGWTGTCYKGWSADFNWLEDPYMWAQFAVSAAGQGMADGFGKEGGNQWSSMAQEAGLKNAEAAKMATCMANAGIDVAKGIDDYFNNREIPCKPKDEICEENKKSNSSSNTHTFTALEFEEFKATLANQLKESELEVEKYFTILKIDGSGSGAIYTVTYKIPEKETEDSDAGKKAEKARRIKLAVEVAGGTAKSAACYTGASGGASGRKKGEPIGSATGIANQAIGMFVPPIPYGIAAQLALNTLTSYTRSNSCSSHSDAKEKGSLHKKTYQAKKYGMCHQTAEVCEFKLPINTGGCDGKRYYFCCYDQPFTKILMVQVKAQLGKTWENCADLSLNELKSLKFRQCTDDEMDSTTNGGYIDGAGYMANNKNSFQYKYQCMNLNEFKEWIKGFTDRFDEQVFKDALEDFQSGFENEI